MISQFSKPQKAIVNSAREFAKGEFDKEQILELDRAGKFPKEIWEQAATLGFIGIHLSESYGGGGMTMTEQVLMAETLCAHDSTLGSAIMLSGIGGEWLEGYAGEEVKERYLPGILRGRILPGTVIAKPGLSVTVSETGTEETLRVNGEIDGVLNGGRADVYFLPTEKGFVILDAAQDGVKVEKTYQPLGLRMTVSAKMRFADAEIPKANYIHMKKSGFSQLLPEVRILLSALALGTARGAMDRAISHVKKREQFGHKLSGFQVLRHKLAKMETQLLQSRCLTFSAAESYASQKPDNKLIAAACIAAVSSAVEISYEAVQLLGGYGYTVEYEVERYYRDAKTLQLLSGGSLALYDEVADGILGKTLHK